MNTTIQHHALTADGTHGAGTATALASSSSVLAARLRRPSRSSARLGPPGSQSDRDGIRQGLPLPEYLAAPGVSHTMLRHLARSPAHLRAYLAQPAEPTPAMLLGRVLHQRVLAPTQPAFWVVKPEGLKLSTKEGKAWHASVNHPPRVLSHADWEHVEGMAHAIREHATAALALRQGQAAVSLFAGLPALGRLIRCKTRLDFVPRSGNALVDLMTTEDARPEAFARTAFQLGCHRRAAFALDLWNTLAPPEDQRRAFVLVVVEKEPPHAVAVYEMSTAAVAAGRASYRGLLALHACCAALGQWPGYDPEVRVLDLPDWVAGPEWL